MRAGSAPRAPRQGGGCPLGTPEADGRLNPHAIAACPSAPRAGDAFPAPRPLPGSFAPTNNPFPMPMGSEAVGQLPPRWHGRSRSRRRGACAAGRLAGERRRLRGFQGGSRPLGGEREGRSPLARSRTVQVVGAWSSAPRSRNAESKRPLWRGAGGAEPARKTTHRAGGKGSAPPSGSGARRHDAGPRSEGGLTQWREALAPFDVASVLPRLPRLPSSKLTSGTLGPGVGCNTAYRVGLAMWKRWTYLAVIALATR